MSVDYFIDHQHRVVVVSPRGTVSGADVFGYERKLRNRPDIAGYRALVDMNEIEELVQPSTDQIHELARTFARTGASGGGPRLALCAHKDFLFGLARMFASYCEGEGAGASDVGVFRTLDEAAEFLQLPGDLFSRSPIRVLVVDGHEDWRRHVRSLLLMRPEWRVIDEASDGREAIQKARELRPDLIVLDIGLPNLNGIEAARQIQQVSPHSRIIFLSMEASLDVVHAALSTGAQGYVYKAEAQSDLLPAIAAVLADRQFISRRLEGHQLTDSHGTKAHRHEVLFYSDDSVFLDSLALFITAALKAGDVAVAIVIEPHRDSLALRLKTQGVDIDAALREGTYIPLDVAKMLSKFMVNDMPDPDRFFEVVGGFIRVAAKAGKGKHPRVAACGECAPLLRAEGKLEAAIRLEQLWDQLVTAYQVDTLCAYSFTSFLGEKDEDAYERICAEHSAVFRL